MKIEMNKVKIFVTIPCSHVAQVREAVCKAGGGMIGNYSWCTYAVKGTGTFLPNQQSNPHIGKAGTLEFVEEEKLEVLCDVLQVKNVVQAIRKAHPYEEPAIDIVPILDETCFE